MRRGIPVKISLAFWITAAIIGWINSASALGIIIWIGIVFVSVLVHEYGHALTSKLFGQSPRIELVAFGGLTFPEGPKLPLWKEFIVVLNGPLFGFGLFLLSSFLLQIPAVAQSSIAQPLQVLRIVNLFWTIVNLLPILPMDGGQLMRIIFESFLGVKGVKITVMISMVLAIIGSIYFFIIGAFLIGAIFALFAFQNLQMRKLTQQLANSDQDQKLQQEMQDAEEALFYGKESLAKQSLETVRQEAKEGVIFITATQDLAKITFKENDLDKTYNLLKEIEPHLAGEFIPLLHYVAFEKQDYPCVIHLSAHCFQMNPSAEVALRNAMAFASHKEAKSCVGWLEAAIRCGLDNMDQVLNESVFDPLRQDVEFLNFMKQQKKTTSE